MTDPYLNGPVVYILRNSKSLYVGATIDLAELKAERAAQARVRCGRIGTTRTRAGLTVESRDSASWPGSAEFSFCM